MSNFSYKEQHAVIIKVDSEKEQKELFERLKKMGLKLFEIAFKDLLIGVIKRTPQDKRFSTFEPDTSVKDIYKPDLLMLEYIKSHN